MTLSKVTWNTIERQWHRWCLIQNLPIHRNKCASQLAIITNTTTTTTPPSINSIIYTFFSSFLFCVFIIIIFLLFCFVSTFSVKVNNNKIQNYIEKCFGCFSRAFTICRELYCISCVIDSEMRNCLLFAWI